MSGKPKQYMATMMEAFEYVEREWAAAGRAILGERGFCAVHIQSVRKAHPALPVCMQALVGTVTAANGCMVELWGAPMPVALWVVNVNYSQTRKSGLSSISEVYASAVDGRVRKMFREILELKQSATWQNTAAPFSVISLSVCSDCSFFHGVAFLRQSGCVWSWQCSAKICGDSDWRGSSGWDASSPTSSRRFTACTFFNKTLQTGGLVGGLHGWNTRPMQRKMQWRFQFCAEPTQRVQGPRWCACMRSCQCQSKSHWNTRPARQTMVLYLASVWRDLRLFDGAGSAWHGFCIIGQKTSQPRRRCFRPDTQFGMGESLAANRAECARNQNMWVFWRATHTIGEHCACWKLSPRSCSGDGSGATRRPWVPNQGKNVLCDRQTHPTPRAIRKLWNPSCEGVVSSAGDPQTFAEVGLVGRPRKGSLSLAPWRRPLHGGSGVFGGWLLSKLQWVALHFARWCEHMPSVQEIGRRVLSGWVVNCSTWCRNSRWIPIRYGSEKAYRNICRGASTAEVFWRSPETLQELPSVFQHPCGRSTEQWRHWTGCADGGLPLEVGNAELSVDVVGH